VGFVHGLRWATYVASRVGEQAVERLKASSARG
jgi:hypothetical protein